MVKPQTFTKVAVSAAALSIAAAARDGNLRGSTNAMSSTSDFRHQAGITNPIVDLNDVLRRLKEKQEDIDNQVDSDSDSDEKKKKDKQKDKKKDKNDRKRKLRDDDSAGLKKSKV